MSRPDRCDVLVIGGGPAGTTAATLLRSKGYDVVLVEKSRHPRPHVGESLIPQFWKVCDALGVSPAIEAEGFRTKSGGTVAWNGRIHQFSFRDFGFSRPALHVERDRFDWILFEHARRSGVYILDETVAVAVDLSRPDGPLVDCVTGKDRDLFRIRARYLVDATGQNALLATRLGLRRLDRAFRYAALWGYFEGSAFVGPEGRVHPFAQAEKVPPQTFVASLPCSGWSWHIPLRRSTSVGLVVPLDELNRAKRRHGDLRDYFLHTCRTEESHLARLLSGARLCDDEIHVIRDYSYRTTELAGPGYFLVGDAAGFIDPIFSIGVVLAFYSGYLAAWAVERSLREPHRAEDFRRLYGRQLRGRLEMARSLALPTGESTDGHERAREAIGFLGSGEQELASMLTELTSRSASARDALIGPEVMRSALGKFRELPEIRF